MVNRLRLRCLSKLGEATPSPYGSIAAPADAMVRNDEGVVVFVRVEKARARQIGSHWVISDILQVIFAKVTEMG